MKFFVTTPGGLKWAEDYFDLPSEAADKLGDSTYTDYAVLAYLRDHNEPMSSPEISSGLRITEELDYSTGQINLSLKRLSRKNLVKGKDWG